MKDKKYNGLYNEYRVGDNVKFRLPYQQHGTEYVVIADFDGWPCDHMECLVVNGALGHYNFKLSSISHEMLDKFMGVKQHTIDELEEKKKAIQSEIDELKAKRPFKFGVLCTSVESFNKVKVAEGTELVMFKNCGAVLGQDVDGYIILPPDEGKPYSSKWFDMILHTRSSRMRFQTPCK